MTQRETLYANYEDALFTLMMDSVAQSEGERLLRENARLNQDPDAALPEPLLRRCLKTMDRAFSKQHRQAAGRAARKVIKFLPLVAVIIAMMAVLAYAAFPEFRADVLNLLVKHNTNSIDWSFEDGTGIDAQSAVPESPTFTVELPEGYVLAEFWNNTKIEQATYLNQYDESQNIIISVLHSAYTTASSDIEDADYYEQTKIQEYKAVLTIKDGLTHLIWGSNEIPCYVVLEATNLDFAVVKQIAESVIVKELQEK